jgi:hypothetical protein
MRTPKERPPTAHLAGGAAGCWFMPFFGPAVVAASRPAGSETRETPHIPGPTDRRSEISRTRTVADCRSRVRVKPQLAYSCDFRGRLNRLFKPVSRRSPSVGRVGSCAAPSLWCTPRS